MLGWDTASHAMVAFAAGFTAGALNSVAGGGTIVSFPVLMWLGIPAVEANISNSVILWPGSCGAIWGFRRDIMQTRQWWTWLAVPSFVGGAVGAYLLLHTPPAAFRRASPS